MVVRYKRGFTLIELLIVIAIISLLSSILLASVAIARTKAQLVATYVTAQEYITALQSYDIDHSYFPYSTDQTDELWCASSKGCIYYGTPLSQSTDINQKLAPYLPPVPTVSTGYLPIFGSGMQGLMVDCMSYDTVGLRCAWGHVFWPQSGGKCIYGNATEESSGDGQNTLCSITFGDRSGNYY